MKPPLIMENGKLFDAWLHADGPETIVFGAMLMEVARQYRTTCQPRWCHHPVTVRGSGLTPSCMAGVPDIVVFGKVPGSGEGFGLRIGDPKTIVFGMVRWSKESARLH
jgi:hypothetical protein